MAKTGRKITLNIVNAHGNLVPSSASSIEYGSSYYRPESKATGGAQFQYHRNQLQFSYAFNCVPTENGLQSVELKEKDAYNLPSSHYGRFVTTHCDKCEEFLTYSCDIFKSVQDIHEGTLLLSKNGLHRVTAFNPLEREEVKVNGLVVTDDAVLGLLSMRNRNFIYTKDEVYINSMEKWFDYIPSIRTGAGKFSILSYIGHIITMVQAVDSVYIFGTHGAVFSDTCSGDGDYPFNWRQVDNHTGIRNRDDVVSKDGAIVKIVVNSNDGLQILDGTNATNILTEESRMLRKGAFSYFKVDCFEKDVCLCDGEYPEQHTLLENTIIGNEFKDSNYQKITEGCYENYLDKLNRQHIRVNNFINYITISFATVTTTRCGEDCVCFTRLMVFDIRTDRYTVLHIQHTDVDRAAKDEDALLTIINKDKVYSLVEGGIGYVYFKDFKKTNLKGFTISKVELQGRFPIKPYEEEQDKNLTYIPAWVGLDQVATAKDNSMELVGFGNNYIYHHGRWRGDRLTFILPFSGSLNEILMMIV